jgi:hypothetical protein
LPAAKVSRNRRLDPADADTNATVSVGLANAGAIASPWTAYFDNIVAAVHR